MKKTQITIGGRLKFNIGPFEVEAIAINDNLGVIFHAFSPKQEPQKIEEHLSTDDHLPFGKELNDLWADIRKDEELNGLMNDSNLRIVLKGLTIATTHFPVLYENPNGFFNGKDKRELYLYNSKGEKTKCVIKNGNDSVVLNGYELPKNLMKDNKPALEDYSLIPLREVASSDNFFPLNDWAWEIELDIEVVSTKKQTVVVQNPVYLKGKNDYIAGQLKEYESKDKTQLKWEFSEILDYITQQKVGDKTLKELFQVDTIKSIFLDKILLNEMLMKYKEEELKKINFDTQFEQLKNDIEKVVEKIGIAGDKLKTVKEIFDFIKTRIEGKVDDRFKDVDKFISTQLQNVLLKYASNYDKKSDVEKKAEQFDGLETDIKNVVEKIGIAGDKLKTVDEIFNFIKTKILSKTAYAFDDLEKYISNDLKNLLLSYTYTYNQWQKDSEKNVSEAVDKYKEENSTYEKIEPALIKKLGDKITLSSKVSEWIKDNQNKLAENDKKTTVKDLSTSAYTKVFKPVDELYLLAMSPKERAGYNYERYNDISNKYIKVNTNQVDNLFDLGAFGLKELQFKFKRTLSEQLRNKLSEIYNNTDVFQSKIVAKEKELEEKQKLLTESEEDMAKVNADMKVQLNALEIIDSNNTYYKQLIQSHKAIVSKVLGKKITLFDDLDVDKIQNDKTEYKNVLNQALKLELSRADKGELEMLALGIEKYVNLDDDVSIKDGELKVANLTKQYYNLESKRKSIIKQQEDLKVEIDKFKNDKKAETQKDEDSKFIVKLSEHPRLALHPDWYDKEAKKLKFPTLQDRVMTALKEFGK